MLTSLSLVLLATIPAQAQEAEDNPQVVNEDYPDTSIPIREIAPGGRFWEAHSSSFCPFGASPVCRRSARSQIP
jgi:hypothetical protein